MLVWFFILPPILGLIPAIIASQKGHSFGLWWLFGAALFIVALPVAILIKPVESPHQAILHAQQLASQTRCPRCAEVIQAAAHVCRYCGAEQPLALEYRYRLVQREHFFAEAGDWRIASGDVSGVPWRRYPNGQVEALLRGQVLLFQSWQEFYVHVTGGA